VAVTRNGWALNNNHRAKPDFQLFHSDSHAVYRQGIYMKDNGI
jgi:hypothetical protein